MRVTVNRRLAKLYAGWLGGAWFLAGGFLFLVEVVPENRTIDVPIRVWWPYLVAWLAPFVVPLGLFLGWYCLSVVWKAGSPVKIEFPFLRGLRGRITR